MKNDKNHWNKYLKNEKGILFTCAVVSRVSSIMVASINNSLMNNRQKSGKMRRWGWCGCKGYPNPNPDPTEKWLIYVLAELNKRCSATKRLPRSTTFLRILCVGTSAPLHFTTGHDGISAPLSATWPHLSSSFRLFYGSGFDLTGPSSQSFKHLCIFGLYGAM